MKTSSNPTRPALKLGLALMLGLGVSAPSHAVNMLLNNVDAANSGFNDTTPAQPVGGNNGTTVGEQRRVVMQHAFDLWGDALDGSVDVVVQASFAPLNCLSSSGTLGHGEPMQTVANFPGAPKADTAYPVALANQLAGEDLTPGALDSGPLAEPKADDIVLYVNNRLGDTFCLPEYSWYYGLDNQAGERQMDFLNLVMHELAHGLGFHSNVDPVTGEAGYGMPSAYDRLVFDREAGLSWGEMSDERRKASAVNHGNVVWNGGVVSTLASGILARGVAELRIGPDGEILPIGTASFGPGLSVTPIEGEIVLADDATHPDYQTQNDACQALVNVADISGNIALVSRGSCSFTQKARNVQAAGARAMIVFNNSGTGIFGLAGDDDEVTIPVVSVSQKDGLAIKAQLPGLSASLLVNGQRIAGATAEGRVKLFTPKNPQAYSTIVHFDHSARPDLLMEPSIGKHVRANHNLDMTALALLDIGWSVSDANQFFMPIVEQCRPIASEPLFGLACFQQIATGLLQSDLIGIDTYNDLIDLAVNYQP